MAKQLKKAIMVSFAADRITDELRAKGIRRNYTTILAIGPKSVGKTATAEMAAREIAKQLGKKFVFSPNPGPDEFGFTIANLDADTAESIGGLYEVVDGDTVVYPHTYFPKGGTGLMVVDEFNRITPTAAPALQQLADQHKLAGHAIPPGWTVVFLGNPPQAGDDDTYMVNDGFDSSFFSRLCILPVTITKDDWVEYALENDIDPDVLNFAAIADDVLKNQDPLDVSTLFPITDTPRSLETLSNLLKGGDRAAEMFDMDSLREDENLLTELATGCIGSTKAIAFVRSRTLVDKPFKALDILEHYTEPTKDADGNLGPTYQEKIQEWSDISNNQKSQLAHITMTRVLRHIAEVDMTSRGDNGKITPEAEANKNRFEKVWLPNIDTFLGDLRHEEVLLFTTKLRTEVGPRGVKVVQVMVKHNQELLEDLNNSLDRDEQAA